MYYSIGEFSKVTNLTPKMLKIYHEMGLLIPAKVDEFSKYRCYNESNFEAANLISFFKQFDFSLAEIKEIVDNQDDELILTEFLEKQKDVIENKITKYNFVMGLINGKLNRRIIMSEKNSKSEQRSRFWKLFSKLIGREVSMADSLKIASDSADDELKSVIADVINEIEEGKKLHDTMGKYNTVFTELEIFVINPYSEEKCLNTASIMLGDCLEKVGFPDNSEEQKNTRSNYWKTFGLLLDSGVSLTKGMEIASEWADEKVKAVTKQMIEEICNGIDYFTTLKDRPEIFTELEIELIRIGEQSGYLDIFLRILPSVVKMKEVSESENEKRKDFWKVIGEFKEENAFESIDNKAYDANYNFIVKFNENKETNEKRKLPDRNNFHLFQDVIRVALFVADDKLRAISKNIMEEIREKKTLSSIMEKHPDIFQEFETKLITLGEANKNIGKAAHDIIEIL
ncbi:MAG TPA: type II secretion system F family protein [Clostridiales bacterium]|nr:type II secretion system F family protein [Clostridiales bacterium]HQP70672.1 type II secretion system F family protein [Clostridiales bacterium]